MNDYVIAMDKVIKENLDVKFATLEKILSADIIYFYGSISSSQVKLYRDLIEGVQDKYKHKKLVVILNTPGGDVIAVEKFAEINRQFYTEVDFIIPDSAMSAGTVFCLSGDNILMEYSSSLGPVDPQIFNEKQGIWVSAIGYIDKMNEAIQKSFNNCLSDLEFMLLRDIDLAFLRECEQQMNLTIQLIKTWLVKYKFKDWAVHSSNNKVVTEEEKEIRAEQIASMLSDNKYWCAHGRFIGIRKLREILKLKIEDYGENPKLKKALRDYNSLAFSYINRHQIPNFFHTRNFNAIGGF